MLFPDVAVTDVILGQLFVAILSLIFSIFAAGLSYMYLNMARGREYSFGDMVYFFKNHPDRVITATILMTVLSFLVTIPLNYYLLTTDSAVTTQAEAIKWLMNVELITLAIAVLDVLISIPFSMMYFLLADNPEMTGFEAMKTSVRMMKRRFGKYLLMQISFIPLLFFSMFTLFIALLWIMPYIEMSTVMFYRDILGELDPVEQPVQEVFGAAELAQRMEMQDDNHSEA